MATELGSDSISVVLWGKLIERWRGVSKMGNEERSTQTKETIADGGFKLYPNPAMQQLTVEYGLKEGETVRLYLYDLMGAVHISENLAKGKTQMDISAFANGVYLVMLEVDGKAVHQSKLVIMK